MDPGNFATNIQAGSRYGFSLLWVVIAANAIAMLFQAMSAKIGIVTNRNLAELCRDHFPKPVTVLMWITSELAAIATDLAEFLGAALAIALLVHVPLLVGMVATAFITMAILIFGGRGFRPLELIVGSLVAIVGSCYLYEVLAAAPDWRAVAAGTVPRIAGTGALTLAVGIVGATVMPHAIFLHSGLTQSRAPARSDRERTVLLRFSNREVILALTFAGLVNLAMVMVAAAVMHADPDRTVQIEDAFHILVPLFGGAAAAVFLLSLLAAGISSSVVGTMAGQVMMQGFVGFHIPVALRRAVTIVPSLVVVALGVDVTHALVASQVVLSLVLPMPMIALIILSRRRDIMGAYTASARTSLVALVATFVVLVLNGILIVQTIRG